MTIYLGADHRGFAQKEVLKQWLISVGYPVIDCGNFFLDQNDGYPEFAIPVAKQVKQEPGRLGVLCCGSGVGMSIAANKMPGIRCGVLFNVEQARAARFDDDINVIALASDFTDHEYAKQIVLTALETQFRGEEKYRQRLLKVHQLEQG